MKKTILVSLCIIITAFSAQAQSDSTKPKDSKVKFGLRTGYEFQVNNSNLDYKLNVPYIGVFSNIKLGEKWSSQLELNLRSEQRERRFNDGVKESNDAVYLTVPVLLKYHINDKFNIYTGTQVLTVSLNNDIIGIKKPNSILGVEYNLNKNFLLEARFRHGFENRKFNNFRDNRISVGIGYKF